MESGWVHAAAYYHSWFMWDMLSVAVAAGRGRRRCVNGPDEIATKDMFDYAVHEHAEC